MKRGVTHPEQRGVKRLSVRTAWAQGRTEGGGAVTHTQQRSSDGGHLLASCGAFPVEEEESGCSWTNEVKIRD